ncbi:MAG: R3H domain-containing nucleic acid-binding protein [Microcoleaceae cyanobacterium]
MDNQQIESAQTWLEQLLKLANLPASVTATAEPDSYWLTINAENYTPEQVAALTGASGDGLDGMQYLINTLQNIGKDEEHRTAYTVELNGYRSRRYRELQALAENAANQVRQTGVELEIKSLSSVERRLIHSLLQDSEDIETYSRGQDPDRRLVIKTKSYA